jgi:hypothetical protein
LTRVPSPGIYKDKKYPAAKADRVLTTKYGFLCYTASVGGYTPEKLKIPL